MIGFKLLFKEVIVLFLFILLVFLEAYLIKINLLYIALFDGIFSFILGIHLFKSLMKKMKNPSK